MEILNLTAELTIVTIVLSIICLAFFILMVVCIVLYIKVTRRGIKALDIYINRNSRPYYPGGQNYYGSPQDQNPQQVNPPVQKPQ